MMRLRGCPNDRQISRIGQSRSAAKYFSVFAVCDRLLKSRRVLLTLVFSEAEEKGVALFVRV